MAPADPFAFPPGPVHHYVERAVQLAAEHQMDLQADIAAGVERYIADIRAQALVLAGEGDSERFLGAVRSQIRLMIPTDPKTLKIIADDAGSVRRIDTLVLITRRLP
jgi:hypothetical protein